MTLTRRDMFGAAAGLITSPAFTAAALAQTGFDWDRYKGQSIEVLLAKSPRSDLFQRDQKEFEALTGIKVGAEQVPEQQQRQKMVVEFASGRTSFDVAFVAPHVQKRISAKGRWLADLRPLIADKALTNPEFDAADFPAGIIRTVSQRDGSLTMLPINVDHWIMFWNKPMWEAKGIAYPTSFPAILDAARTLNDPAHNVAGCVMRGQKNANTLVWVSMLIGYGVDAVSPDGKLNTDGPEAIEAARLYQALAREAGPAGMAGFNWPECQSSFAQGRAAMWFDTNGLFVPLEDAARSRVVGQVGYGVMPPGPAAHRVGLTSDALAISASSRKKEAAWFYLQWAAGKSMQAKQLAQGFGAPPRSSAYETLAAQPEARVNRDWLACAQQSSALAYPSLPDIVAVTEFRDVFGIALANMIGGADPATELRSATAAFKPILERTEA